MEFRTKSFLKIIQYEDAIVNLRFKMIDTGETYKIQCELYNFQTRFYPVISIYLSSNIFKESEILLIDCFFTSRFDSNNFTKYSML